MMTDERQKKKIDYYTYTYENKLIRFTLDNEHICLIGVYEPEEEKNKKLDTFCGQLQKINKDDHLIDNASNVPMLPKYQMWLKFMVKTLYTEMK